MPTLTAEGQRHPVTSALPGADAPWGPWLRQVEMSPPSGRVLMTGRDALPLLVLSQVNKGRVALLTSDTIWLWAKGWEGGGPQGELLRRLAHWLMKEPDLEEDAVRARLDDGQLLLTRRTMGSLPTTARVLGPDGQERTVPLTATGPGSAEARVSAPWPGVYRVETPDGGRALAVAGQPNPLETTRLTPTDALLAPLARDTGGSVTWAQEGLPAFHRVAPGQPARGPGWVGVVANGRHVVSGVTLSPVLDTPLALVLILGGLALAWFREGRSD
ncbi:hypothetical protein [Pararhodospirillum photometricum]|uniref:hypothetical protein n=1 Tax=Pararhodospirillum photometricum TaxID=1084 RepID=UPI001F5A6281|nr:hypothetical protein [Pararhodospirillum photometricum]